MRVSSKLRAEASKIFWAQPHAYYVIEAEWFFDGAWPGCTYDDVTFMSQVQNLEMNYNPTFGSPPPGSLPNDIEFRTNEMNRFWAVLQQRFPRVKRIAINFMYPPWQALESDGQGAPPFYMLFKTCPAHIEASVLFLEKQKLQLGPNNSNLQLDKWCRSLFQWSDEDGWIKSELGNQYETILIPLKPFKGPVGEFYNSYHQMRQHLPYAKHELLPLVVEAIDSSHFEAGDSAPLSCPAARCLAQFQRPGEFTVHAADKHNVFHAWKFLDKLPKEYSARLHGRFEAVASKVEENVNVMRKLETAWTANGGQYQPKIKADWMEQLNNDPAWQTGEKAEDSQLWLTFLYTMRPKDEYSILAE